METKYRPCIWFDGNAVEAAEYYADVFPGARIGEIVNHPEGQPDFNKHMEGKPLTVAFFLDNHEYIFLNAGPMFPHTENFSIEVMCEDQEEVDLYWNRLVGDGGQESACGWCKDKFGLHWQIVPRVLIEGMTSPDKAAAKLVMEAMMEMVKIDIATIEAARRG